MKMKALVKSKPEPGIWLEEVAVPEIGINDVLIKILKTSICGTDVHIYNWDAWAQKTIPVPMHVGHEFVGTVAEIGDNVHFSAQTLVTRSFTEPGYYSGNLPAGPNSIWRRTIARLRQLDDITRRLKKLEKYLGSGKSD